MSLVVTSVDSVSVLQLAIHRLEAAASEQRCVPFTTLAYAQSLDGSIAAAGRQTLQLSNERSRRLTHQLRALHDAILVGIDTVLIDNPQLTVRLVPGKNPQPVVVDGQLRFPLQARLLDGNSIGPVIATRPSACPRKKQQLFKAGATIIEAPVQDDGLLDLCWLWRWLWNHGYRSLMVEGGARVIRSVLRLRLADQLILTISPRFVGGWSALGPESNFSCDAGLQLANLDFDSLDGDVVLRGDFFSAGRQRRLTETPVG